MKDKSFVFSEYLFFYLEKKKTKARKVQTNSRNVTYKYSVTWFTDAYERKMFMRAQYA